MSYTTFTVTVNNPGSGNKYYIDGVLQASVPLAYGATYRFDQSDSSNATHGLRISTTSDGTHSGGSAYVPGVTVVGTPGQAGAYTEFFVTEIGPPITMYYYCVNHPGMGGTLNLSSNSWGAKAWGNGTWSNQGHIDEVVSGQSLTSNIGSLQSITANADVQPSGIQLSSAQGSTVGGTSVLIENPGPVTASLGVGQVVTGFGVNTTGSSLTSSIGSATIDESTLTGEGWGRAAWGEFAWGVNYSVAVTGQSLSTAMGEETSFSDVTVSVTGQSLTSTQGIISLKGDFGIVVFAAEDQLDGVVGTATTAANADISVSGIGLSGGIGQVVPEPKVPVDVTGIQGTFSIGSISLEQTTVEPVTGQTMSMSLGEESQVSKYPVTGSSLSSSIGSVTLTIGADIDVSGITLSASIGNVVVTPWQEVNLGVSNVWTEVDLAA